MAGRRTRLTHAIGGALDEAPGPLRAALAALEGAFVSLVLIVLPVFVVWLASPNVTVGGWRAAQLGLAGWCLSHGGALAVRIGTVSLVPLLATGGAILTATWAATRLAAGLARAVPGRLRWAGDLRRDVAVEGAVFVSVYTGVGLLAALAARTADFAPSVPRSLLGFAAVALLSYVLGLRAEFRADLPEVAPGWRLDERVPVWARAGWGAGWRALAWLLLAGLLLVFLLLIVRFDRVAGLYDALSPGLVGGVVLTGAQALYLPDLAVWALSWLAGPGFGIGADSSITLTTSVPGLMPLIPFLGALPEPGPLPALVRVALVVPLVAGALLERRTGRLVGADPLERALAAASGCLIAGLGAALAGALAGGSLGSSRLSSVGAPPLLLGAMVAGELALGAAIALGAKLARSGSMWRAGGQTAPAAGSGERPGADGALTTRARLGIVRGVRGSRPGRPGRPGKVGGTPSGAAGGRPEWPSRRG